jgi:hypothetical protein
MVFDVSVEGHDNAPLILMLHEFGVPRFFWNAQVPALAQAGFFAAFTWLETIGVPAWRGKSLIVTRNVLVH